MRSLVLLVFGLLTVAAILGKPTEKRTIFKRSVNADVAKLAETCRQHCQVCTGYLIGDTGNPDFESLPECYECMYVNDQYCLTSEERTKGKL